MQGSCHPRHFFHLDKLFDDSRQDRCGWRVIAALQRVVLVPAFGFSRWHVRGYTCLLEQGQAGYELSSGAAGSWGKKVDIHACVYYFMWTWLS